MIKRTPHSRPGPPNRCSLPLAFLEKGHTCLAFILAILVIVTAPFFMAISMWQPVAAFLQARWHTMMGT